MNSLKNLWSSERRSVLIFFFSLCLNLTGLDWGLPNEGRNAFYPTDISWQDLHQEKRLYQTTPYQSYHADETHVLDLLAGMNPTEMDFAPRSFYYPTLWIYVTGAVLKSAEMFKFVDLRPSKKFYVEHPNKMAHIYLFGRGAVALFASLGVAMLYFCSLTLFDRATATWSAIFLAVTPLWVRNAHFMLVTLPSTVWMIASAWLAALAIRKGSLQAALASALFAGFAASTKYPSGSAFLLALFAFSMLPRRSAKAFIGLNLALVAGFLIGAPYSLLFPQEMLSDLREVSQLNRGDGEASNLAFQLIVSQGTTLALISILGFALIFYRIRSWRYQFMMSWLIAGIAYRLISEIDAVRLLLPMMPVLALMAGRLVVWCQERLSEQAGVQLVPRGVALFVLLMTASYSFNIVSCLRNQDIRDRAAEWIDATIPYGQTIAILSRMYSDLPIIDSTKFPIVQVNSAENPRELPVIVLSSESFKHMGRHNLSQEALSSFRRTSFSNRPLAIWTWPLKHRPSDWVFTFLDIHIYQQM